MLENSDKWAGAVSPGCMRKGEASHVAETGRERSRYADRMKIERREKGSKKVKRRCCVVETPKLRSTRGPTIIEGYRDYDARDPLVPAILQL